VNDQFLELEVGRCLNCGYTIDLTVVKMQAGKYEGGVREHNKALV